MPKRSRLPRTLVFSAAVGGALAFGAHTAVAAVPAADVCPDYSIGRCATTFGCQLHCNSQYGSAPTTGVCENNCCFCLE